MGPLVSTDLTWTAFVRSAGHVWCLESSIINSSGWWGRWVCGRRRAFPRFSSLLGKRGKRRRSAKPIVHISTGLAVTTIVTPADDPRGAHHWRGRSRRKLVFGRSAGIGTMMQSCASAAKLRGGGSILDRGTRAMSAVGAPPPRLVNGGPHAMAERRNPVLCWSPGQPSGCCPQYNALRNLAGGHQAPQRDEQFARQRDDHGLAGTGPPIRRALLKPLRQRTVFLEH